MSCHTHRQQYLLSHNNYTRVFLLQIYFHTPSDIPDYSHSSMKISKNTHSFVQIVNQLSVTDVGLENWTPEARGCYYLNEKWLKYTKIYSYINCYVECQVNATESLCGCVPMIRISTKNLNESIKNIILLLNNENTKYTIIFYCICRYILKQY